MLRRYSINFTLLTMGVDALWVAVALWLSDRLRPAMSQLPFARSVPEPQGIPFPLFFLFPGLWVALLALLAVYDGRRGVRLSEELATLSGGALLATIAAAGILYLSFRDISRLAFLTFALLSYAGQVGWHLGTYQLLQHPRRSTGRRVLIVGAGETGRQLAEQINTQAYAGLQVIGFLDDVPSPQVVGNIAAARQVVADLQVEDVVLALPGNASPIVNRLVNELLDLPLKLWVIPDEFRLALYKAKVQNFAGLPLLDLRAPALSDSQRLLKRAFDLTLGTLFTLLALPLMAAIALAIRLDSPGAALFKQRRAGENGRLFWMYKFRSMCADAEDRQNEVTRSDAEGNLIHKIPDDPRVTRMGRFLRRFSLDELPNLFNVLRGEMSLVGPRPELPHLVQQYQPWQRTRFAVPQGMTGWWQVTGRSDKPMHLFVEDDLYYVQNYSLLLDVRILLKTFWAVWRGKGAY